MPASKARLNVLRLWLIMAALLATAGCVPVTRPVVKIGLVAPFEGRYRDVGYEVIYAVRLAVREANTAGGVAGYTIELTALDDGGDPSQAAEQALKMAADPAILGVIGHWLDRTTYSAGPVYAAEGLPVLATTLTALPPGTFRLWLTPNAIESAAAGGALCPLPCDNLEDLDWLKKVRAEQPTALVFGPPLWEQTQFVDLAGPLAEGARFAAAAPYPAESSDRTFAERYRGISNGVEPGPNAVLAYDAANVLFAALRESVDHGETPSRKAMGAALATVHYDGLSGPIRFAADGNWADAKAWVYEWRGGKVLRP
jgi:ABC-type branched-subunit amino acid transport system substrate-binding protein